MTFNLTDNKSWKPFFSSAFPNPGLPTIQVIEMRLCVFTVLQLLYVNGMLHIMCKTHELLWLETDLLQFSLLANSADIL